MLNAHPLLNGKPLPLVADIGDAASRVADAAADWAGRYAGAIDDLAARHGVVLIRGFEIDSAAAFRSVCQALRPDLRTYTGGDSPRTELDDKVYTSTEYAPDLEVLLHNELSYAGWSPDRVFFGCLVAPQTGGETPVADGREIYRAIDPAIRDRFERLGIAYLQHLWDADGEPGVGKSWQETFGTRDRTAVERYLGESQMDFEWTPYGLRTRAAHPAVLSHPASDEPCWHNQADQWHRDMESVKISFGDMNDSRFAPETSGEASLGNHVVYGDGSEIDPADLLRIRAASRQCEIVFPWQVGDIMVIDNVAAMHGRKPYTGERRIVVAMA